MIPWEGWLPDAERGFSGLWQPLPLTCIIVWKDVWIASVKGFFGISSCYTNVLLLYLRGPT